MLRNREKYTANAQHDAEKRSMDLSIQEQLQQSFTVVSTMPDEKIPLHYTQYYQRSKIAGDQEQLHFEEQEKDYGIPNKVLAEAVIKDKELNLKQLSANAIYYLLNRQYVSAQRYQNDVQLILQFNKSLPNLDGKKRLYQIAYFYNLKQVTEQEFKEKLQHSRPNIATNSLIFDLQMQANTGVSSNSAQETSQTDTQFEVVRFDLEYSISKPEKYITQIFDKYLFCNVKINSRQFDVITECANRRLCNNTLFRIINNPVNDKFIVYQFLGPVPTAQQFDELRVQFREAEKSAHEEQESFKDKEESEQDLENIHNSRGGPNFWGPRDPSTWRRAYDSEQQSTAPVSTSAEASETFNESPGDRDSSAVHQRYLRLIPRHFRRSINNSIYMNEEPENPQENIRLVQTERLNQLNYQKQLLYQSMSEALNQEFLDKVQWRKEQYEENYKLYLQLLERIKKEKEDQERQNEIIKRKIQAKAEAEKTELKKQQQAKWRKRLLADEERRNQQITYEIEAHQKLMKNAVEARRIAEENKQKAKEEWYKTLELRRQMTEMKESVKQTKELQVEENQLKNSAIKQISKTPDTEFIKNLDKNMENSIRYINIAQSPNLNTSASSHIVESQNVLKQTPQLQIYKKQVEFTLPAYQSVNQDFPKVAENRDLEKSEENDFDIDLSVSNDMSEIKPVQKKKKKSKSKSYDGLLPTDNTNLSSEQHDALGPYAQSYKNIQDTQDDLEIDLM